MNLPGYSLTDPADFSSGDSPTPLPVQERYGASVGVEATNIRLETERGVLWIYPQITRAVRKMTFRCTASQLVDFRTLHDAVNGEVSSFWYFPDIDDDTYLHVRKEKDFLPKELDGPGAVDGNDEAIYDYELTLTGEITPADIES